MYHNRKYQVPISGCGDFVQHYTLYIKLGSDSISHHLRMTSAHKKSFLGISVSIQSIKFRHDNYLTSIILYLFWSLKRMENFHHHENVHSYMKMSISLPEIIIYCLRVSANFHHVIQNVKGNFELVIMCEWGLYTILNLNKYYN